MCMPRVVTRDPRHRASSLMALAIRWVLLSFLIWEILSPCCVLAQAPGDEDDFCLEISSAPAYASSVKPLLDSWRYKSLLGDDGVWKTLDRDNDSVGVRQGLTWFVIRRFVAIAS